MVVEPTLTSFSSIRKMGEILICSLWRKFVEMVHVSKNKDRRKTPSGPKRLSHVDYLIGREAGFIMQTLRVFCKISLD